MMKKCFLLALSVFIIAPCWGVKTKIDIKTQSKNKTDRPVLRSPINLPIEVSFDDEMMTIEVFCVNDVDAEVSVYNASDELEGYSPSLNSVISLTESDYHTIVIEGEDWIATGVIE